MAFSSTAPASSSFFSTNAFAPKTSTPLFNSFIPASTTGSTSTGVDIDIDVDNNPDIDEAEADELYLEPPAFKRADKAKWKASGRTLLAAVSPVNGEIAVWATKKSTDADKPATLSDAKLSIPDRTTYIASINKFAPSVENLYSETFVLFSSLQHIVASSMRLGNGAAADMWDARGNAVDGLIGPPTAETTVHMRQLVNMYLEELLKIREADDVDDEVQLRYESVYHIFSLAQLLYLPQDGRGEGLVGEELLDWVNAVDTIQINDEGNTIMKHKEPWEHQLFWPYVTRCLLRGFFLPASTFLQTLSSHPNGQIAKLGTLLSSHASSMPRSTNTAAYPIDHQFLSAHKAWLTRFRNDIATFIGGRARGSWLGDAGAGTELASLEDDFRGVIELLEGKADRVLQESADWREAVGAWGILVDVGLHRDDLPAVLRRIVDTIPVDSTLLDDSIQSALCSGDIIRTLQGCHDLDIWLAAHLGDVFDKLALIPDDEERFETSLRDYFVLEYADMLMESPSQPALWGPIAEYLAAAGPEGRRRLSEYIVHVTLGLDRSSGNPGQQSMDIETEDNESETGQQLPAEFQHFQKLSTLCKQLGLSEELYTVTSIMAERLLQRGDYGMAAALCCEVENGEVLARTAEKVLDQFVTQGDAEFLRLVDTLPSDILYSAPRALKALQTEDSDVFSNQANGNGARHSTTQILFASRLTFLSEFRDYLLYLREGARAPAATKLVGLIISAVTPVEFWGVLLAESVDLLEGDDIVFDATSTYEITRILEEVVENAQYAPVEYLAQLWRYLQRQPAQSGSDAPAKSAGTKLKLSQADIDAGSTLALRKLEEVRLALARNLARALV